MSIIVAVCAFAAVCAGTASAQWLANGALISEAAKAHVELTGTLLIRDVKEKEQFECTFLGLGTIWAKLDEMTEGTLSACKVTEGACTTPTATVVDLPWLSELSTSGSETKDKLLADGKGEPGMQMKCLILGIEFTDTCKGETEAPLLENLVEGFVLMKFNQGSIINCSIGGTEHGELKGEPLLASVEGLSISVDAEATTHEFLSVEDYGAGTEGAPGIEDCTVASVNCATGNLVESANDLSLGGRGPKLEVARAYNSLLAATESESERGSFGYGWTGSYSASLTVNEGAGTATVRQDNGSSVVFYLTESKYVAGSWVEAKLVKEGTTYVYTLPDQTKLEFNSSGQLTSETDRNGNTLTMTYNASKELETVKDGAGRKLTYTYNAEKLVESVKDPMGRTVKYTYLSGNLASVTLPGEEKARWKFEYNASHGITLMTDGRGDGVSFEYDASHRVSVEKDAMEREHTFTYKTIEGGTETTVVEPNGSKTVYTFNIAGEPLTTTRASGTEIASTTKDQYNSSFLLTLMTDPNEHSTEYGYDSEDNRTSEKDANSNETKTKFDGTHDVETETTPKGETTTIKRDAHGNPETVERTVGGKTQKTTYKYDEHGDVTESTDALEAKTKYEYDANGDREAEIDPEGDKHTWKYNEDSEVTSEVSPRGNVTGGKPTEFTTTIERDEQGRPLKITDPQSHNTEIKYDGDGDIESISNGDGRKTTYGYNADDERTETKEPKSTIKTTYDSEGAITGQTDGNSHTTEYKRNLLEEITEEIDPLARKVKKKYDAAGNLTEAEDAEGRITTYKYDPGNRLTEISYSEGTKPTVKYEYNKDGLVTKMVDSTGETTNTYDELDRLTETTDAHGDKVKYEYNLDEEQTKITYPNGESVTRGYDKTERLAEVKDWLGNVTKFSYNPDSELEAVVFPSESKNEDKYSYNDADQIDEVKMLKGAETLASLVYSRDGADLLEKTVSKGLPGAETIGYVTDEDNRLTKAGSTSYEYDAGNDPTKVGTTTYSYDAGSELEKAGETTFSYNKIGERTKSKPAGIPETTYEYNQAGDLTGVKRSPEGETSEIKDSYTYDGNKMRVSETVNGTAKHLTWDASEQPEPLLSNETNSYIYGPAGMPIEQISSGGTVLYLHHDQQDSTRLLTGTTGSVEGAYTYGAYGNTEEHTGTSTTPLGYDAQYTSSDTGLIYLRARIYDPGTDQFLSVDPEVSSTLQPYDYADDTPINAGDPTGLDTGGLCGQLFANVPAFSGSIQLCHVWGRVDSGWTVTAGFSTGYTEQMKNMLLNVALESPVGRTLLSGVSAGVRVGGQWTNANRVAQLIGVSDIWQISVGWGYFSAGYTEGRKPGGGISRTAMIGAGVTFGVPDCVGGRFGRGYGGGRAWTW